MISTSSHQQQTAFVSSFTTDRLKTPRMMTDDNNIFTDLPMTPELMETETPVNITHDDNLTEYEDYGEYDEYEHAALMETIRFGVPTIFAIIFVVGIVGNAILIFIVLRNKPMRTKPNVLIVNLAIGDFILILFSVPFTSIIFTVDQWYFGNAICKLNESMQTLSLGVSVFTLTALSIDRFIAIVFPLASYTSSRSLTRVIIASVVIWVLSAGLAIMDLLGAHVTPCLHCDIPIEYCNLYPKEWGEEYKGFRVIFRFIVYFAVPLIIILCLYVIIAVVLLGQSLSPNSNMKTDASSSAPPVRRAPKLRHMRQESIAMAKQKESRTKVAKVVLSFVVIFIVCWLPRHVNVICFHFHHNYVWGVEWMTFKVVAFCLMFIYSAINPLALYLLNAEYRRYFKHYLFGCCYAPWRLKNTGFRQSFASSYNNRSTYSMMSSGASCRVNEPAHSSSSRASITTETVDVTASQMTVKTTNTSLDDNKQNVAEISSSTHF